MTTPDESIATQAGLANDAALDDLTGAGAAEIDEVRRETDIETAPAAAGLSNLPDEPDEAHVTAYTAAADDLAQRLEDSGTGHDDGSP